MKANQSMPKWNKKIDCSGVPRVWERKERMRRRVHYPPTLYVKCGDCDEHFEISCVDSKIDMIDVNGVLMNADEFWKIIKWVKKTKTRR